MENNMANKTEHKILITGFDPFDSDSINSSWAAVSALPDEILGWKIIKLELPTVFGKAGAVLEGAVKEHAPDAVICTGQAGGSPGIRLERVAVNIMDARIPDNEGNKPCDEPVIPGGPDGFFTGLPIRKMQNRLAANMIPAEVSYTAGAFVCNSVMYTLLHLIRRKYKKVAGGFIHIPYLPEQAQALFEAGEVPACPPSMSAEQATFALGLCIEELIEDRSDKKKAKDSKEDKQAAKASDNDKAHKNKARHDNKEKRESNGRNVLDKSSEIVRKNAPKVRREVKKLAKNPVVKDVALDALEIAKDAIPNRRIRRIVGVALRAARFPSSQKNASNSNGTNHKE